MFKLFSLWLSIGLFALFVGGCQHPKTNDKFESPKPPPTLQAPVFPGQPDTPSREEVIEFQKALINYITYLEQYYISIGVYYGGETHLPSSRQVNEKLLRCQAMEHLFKEIKLPPPPRFKNKEVEETMHALIDHITELRQRIRENNQYMKALREEYKDCH